MDFCVIVKISKHKVSFWYQSESNAYAPLTIKDSNEIPLYFYVNCNNFIFGNAAKDRFFSNDPKSFGNYFEIIKDPSKHFTIYGNKKPVKHLLYYAVEQYLSYFINTVLYKSDSIESFRQQFPLRFIFQSDIEDKEKSLIENMFLEAGYDNVERIEYNESLFEILINKDILNTNKSILLLEGIDNDLYLKLYKTYSDLITCSSKLEGQGADPRVRILSEMIIEYVSVQNPYLFVDIDVEVSSLIGFAANLLENITPIIKGEAVLVDGKSYWFRVTERSLNERLLYYSNDNIIYTAIDELLRSNNLSSENTIILLGSEEINTSYFLNKLLKKYPNVKGIELSYNNEVLKQIFKNIRDVGYRLTNSKALGTGLSNVSSTNVANTSLKLIAQERTTTEVNRSSMPPPPLTKENRPNIPPPLPIVSRPGIPPPPPKVSGPGIPPPPPPKVSRPGIPPPPPPIISRPSVPSPPPPASKPSVPPSPPPIVKKASVPPMPPTPMTKK
jgi:hypothetical protein